MSSIRQLGKSGLEVTAALGRAGVLLSQSLFHWPSARNFHLLMRQLYAEGVLSFIIIALSGFCIGAVLALQGYTNLVQYGAEEVIGQGVALVLCMELGPVVTSLLFAGRAGSALTAEIGLMKATEQLSSMEMIGVDPMRRIVAPRLWAGIISLPLLSLIFCVVGLWGASVVAVDWLGVYEGVFWGNMVESVDFYEHVWKGMVKTFVFGAIVTWIAVFQGYDCVPTSEGISKATTKTVVYSSVATLGLDFILTMVMFGAV